MPWNLHKPILLPPATPYQITTWALDGDGDVIVPMRYLVGADAIAQILRNRLLFFLGEWFLDQRLGIPYHRDVLVKNPDTVLVSAIFRKVVEDSPGIREVVGFEATFTPSTRTLLITFEAKLAEGSILRAENEPFIYKEAA